MTTGASKRLRTWAWGIFWVVTGPIIVFNVHLSWNIHRLGNAIQDKEAQSEELRQQIKEDERTLLSGWHYFMKRSHEDRKLKEMLAASDSRDDFLVREGPRLAWNRFVSSSPRRAQLGLYVPEGPHRLYFGLINRNDKHPRSALRQWFQSFASDDSPIELPPYGRAPQSIPLLSFELAQKPEVYEIVLELKKDDTVTVSIFGRENELVHEASMTWLKGGRSLVMNQTSRGLAYPNEVTVEERETFDKYIRRGKTFPPLELASIQTKGNDIYPFWLEVGFWIESDAPHCMPAIDVASRIVIERRHGVRVKSPSITMDELGDYFQPYTGGDLMYFRD